MDLEGVLGNVRTVADQFSQQRSERQQRRELVQSDFDQLKAAGFLLTGVPVSSGGVWEDVSRSTRSMGEILRTLARGDASVALVSSMHSSVLGLWLATPDAPPPFHESWQKQRQAVFETALEGAWWGTITSEPGSGGDLAKTKAAARLDGDGSGYRLTGDKHFGSGSGITSFMLTTAVPEGAPEPDWFYLDLRGVPWDGSAGVKLRAPWDGHGMAATQSHAFTFQDFPATRFAWPANFQGVTRQVSPYIGCCFTAVIVGIVETAVELARQQLAGRVGSLRAYEQVEWSQVEVEGWLIQQAYEGMLRAIEQQPDAAGSIMRGKVAIAELAETALRRICRILGGGTFARQSPFGFWFEDVRALGFLRPPWGIAYDRLFESSWTPSP